MIQNDAKIIPKSSKVILEGSQEGPSEEAGSDIEKVRLRGPLENNFLVAFG